jgi:hypothetical protein
MHKGPKFILKNNHNGKSVHATPRHPKIKTCKNNGYKCKVWKYMQVLIFFTIVGSTSSTSIVQEGNETQEHGVKLTFLAIYSL